MKADLKAAYAASKNIYDDTLTQSKWWSKLTLIFLGWVNDWGIADQVLAAIPPNFSGHLLDVPVGTGVFTVAKYSQLPDASVTCLDYSEDMLAQARHRFARAGLDHVVFVQGDVGSLPFADASFDIVLSMNGFHAFPDKKAAFQETTRVLKKGGTFCGCLYIKNEMNRTDFVVNRILAPKGWFTPPFHTLQELKTELNQFYSQVDVNNEKAMAYFNCIK